MCVRVQQAVYVHTHMFSSSGAGHYILRLDQNDGASQREAAPSRVPSVTTELGVRGRKHRVDSTTDPLERHPPLIMPRKDLFHHEQASDHAAREPKTEAILAHDILPRFCHALHQKSVI